MDAAVLPMDFLADLCMLVICQLSLSRLQLRRLALSLLMLTGCTLFARALGSEVHWLMHLPILMLGAAVATGERRPLRILEAAACMLCASAAIAGFCLASGASPMPIFAGAMLLAYLLRRHRHIQFKWNVELQVEMDGISASIPALIDTGNRLHDHQSGLPVLIIEESAAPELAALAESLHPSRLHKLPYGVLGSVGEISCFQPEDVFISIPGTGTLRAPACMAAIYPGRIPGSTRALAPPEFAQAIQDRSFTFEGIQERVRRISYVIFKRKAIHLRSGCSNSQGFGLLHRRQRPASPSADPR